MRVEPSLVNWVFDPVGTRRGASREGEWVAVLAEDARVHREPDVAERRFVGGAEGRSFTTVVSPSW